MWCCSRPREERCTEHQKSRTCGTGRPAGGVFLWRGRKTYRETGERTLTKQETSMSDHWESPGFSPGEEVK